MPDPADSRPPLKQLVYVSRATPPHSAITLRSVLDASRPSNRRDGISGALFCFDGRYVQCLEGPPNRVDATLARIRADRRHQGLLVLVDRWVPARQFGAFDMGHETFDPAPWQRIARADWSGQAGPVPIVGEEPDVLRMLLARAPETVPVEERGWLRWPALGGLLVGVLVLVLVGYFIVARL